MSDLDMPISVVRPWLAERCSYKQQTTLLSALRGCDGAPKEDRSKILTRNLRFVLLRSAEGTPRPGTFMYPTDAVAVAKEFCASIDHYPLHFVTHFAHACEIVGYKHPDPSVRMAWFAIYIMIANALHFNPENEEQMDQRLADGPREE